MNQESHGTPEVGLDSHAYPIQQPRLTFDDYQFRGREKRAQRIRIRINFHIARAPDRRFEG
jgi:hypothetical protein